MKYSELQQRSEKDLKQLIKTLRSKQVELRFNVLSGNIKDIAEMRDNKKTIARALTLLTSRKNETQTKNT